MHRVGGAILVLAIATLVTCIAAKDADAKSIVDEKAISSPKKASKTGPSGLSKKGSVRAAYDDGLEESPEDEASSARSQGLEDTVVRTSAVRAAQIIADASKRGWNVLQSLTGAPSSENKDSIEAGGTDRLKVADVEGFVKATRTGSSDADATDKDAIPQDEYLGSDSEPASQKISAQTRKSSGSSESSTRGGAELSESSDFVKIGEDKFERKYVQAVGDLDGNGVTDFIIHTPLENYSTGAIRVYMMDQAGAVKSSRHIVPGKWGFHVEKGLKQGDRFGTTVYELGDVNGDGIKDIAVTAPGEAKNRRSGSVYVLLMNSDGSVRDSRIIDQGDEKTAEPPCDGSTTEGSEVVEMKERIMRLFEFENGQERLAGTDNAGVAAPESMAEPSERAAVGDCFFSDTHCQCLKVASASMCLDFVETLSDGRSVCTERNCQDSYKCSCDETAKEFCKRSTGKRQVYAKVGPLPDGRVECKQEESTMEVAEVLEGASIPAQKPLGGETAQIGTWTATECACTPKGSLTDPGKCPQFDHTKESDTFCVSRSCKISPTDMVCDIDGKSVCSRKKVQKTIFVDDGAADDPAYIRCHEETVEREVVECTSNCP